MANITVYVNMVGLLVESVSVKGIDPKEVKVFILDDTVGEWGFEDEAGRRTSLERFAEVEKDMNENSQNCEWDYAGSQYTDGEV